MTKLEKIQERTNEINKKTQEIIKLIDENILNNNMDTEEKRQKALYALAVTERTSDSIKNLAKRIYVDTQENLIEILNGLLQGGKE